MNLFEEKDKKATYKCKFAVTPSGESLIIDWDSDLYDHDIFDDIYLKENISNDKDIPTEVGVYTCEIEVEGYKHWTDCGYEYDVNLCMNNIVKIM